MAFIYDVVIVGRRLKDTEEVFTQLVKQTNNMGVEKKWKTDNICDSSTKVL